MGKASPGTAQCWGSNFAGELPTDYLFVMTVCRRNIDHLTAHAISDAAGQLGDGTMTDRLTPTTVPGLSGVASIAVGQQHACAVIDNGKAYCWGANSDGKLLPVALAPTVIKRSDVNIISLAGGRHAETAFKMLVSILP